MGKDDIDVGVVKSGQRALQTLDNVLLRETPTHLLVQHQHAEHHTCLVLGSFLLVPKNTCRKFQSQFVKHMHIAYLCRQDIFITRPLQLLEGLAHLNLALSSCVGLSSVA